MDSYDLEILKGETFSLSITVKDSREFPIDLSSYNVSGYVKAKYSDTKKLVDLNAQRTLPYLSGNINLFIPATGTEVLPVTIGVYDVEMLHTGLGVVTRILKGKANIFPESTF